MINNCSLLLEGITGYVIFLLDTNGRVAYVNPAVQSILLYSPEELITQSFSQVYLPEDRDVDKGKHELSLAYKQKGLSTEGWRMRKDGSKFWADVAITPVFDEAKKHQGYTCVLKDISERKNTELESRLREQRFRLMVEEVRDYGIFMLDVNGFIQSWNEGAKRIKGYQSYEIIGKHFSTFYTKEDLDNGKPAMELEVAKKTGKYEEEGWRVRKNGSVFWANILITALYNEQNQLIGFSKVTRDLTERKEAEERLKQSEERYRLLIEQVKDYGIFMLDEKGKIISWNEGAMRINGYTQDEVVGKYFSIFYTEEDKLNDKPGRELKVAQTKGMYEEEGWRVRKDGTNYWANVVITAIYNQQRALIGYAKVTRDLTERKEAERAIKESYEQYKLLAESFELANRELAAANKELEQFTTIVSHDLQEPVRTIKSFLQLIDIMLDPEQEELKKYIHKATQASTRMKELIQNLLQYSQLSKIELQAEEINVPNLISEALQNLKSSIENAKAKIVVDCHAETIRGDKVQLIQLIQNLVSNALKFTGNDTPEVTVKCIQENGKIKFSVSDNGIGIAKDDLGKIFEIFRRLHTKKQYPGTGIGLSICKKIVERHHGKIWPESAPGKGTTFYFTLGSEKADVQNVPI